MKVELRLLDALAVTGKYLKLSPPKRGSKITVAKNGQLQVPDDPIVPFIQSDGLKSDVWQPVQEVLEIAVERCYANAKRLEWMELHAGDRGVEVYGVGGRLPEDTLRAIQEYKVCIKGPLFTPQGSLPIDEDLREKLDLYALIQPIRYFTGLRSPLQFPHGINFLLFREFTEDLLPELEWKKGSTEAKAIQTLVNTELSRDPSKQVRPDAGVGVKAISATASKRLIRLAADYAIKHKKRSITFAHKGDYLRHTEGLFRDWGFELARKEFNDTVILEEAVDDDPESLSLRGKIIVRDRQSDVMLEELLVRPEDHEIVASTNAYGMLIERMAIAAVNGLGLMPKALLGAKAAIFETTHNLLANEKVQQSSPVSAMLAGVMLFDHLGWKDAGELVTHSILKTISDRYVTEDIASRIDEPQLVGTADFCGLVAENFEEVRKSGVRQAMKRASSLSSR